MEKKMDNLFIQDVFVLTVMREFLLHPTTEFQFSQKKAHLFSNLGHLEKMMANFNVLLGLQLVLAELLCQTIIIIEFKFSTKMANLFQNLDLKETIMDNSYIQVVLQLT